MEFSKNSWHFRFAKKYGGLRTWDEEPYHTSLCGYAKYVFWGLLAFCLGVAIAAYVVIFGIGGLIILFSYGSDEWITSGGFFVASSLILGTIFIVVMFSALSWYCSRRDRRMNTAWMDYVESNPDADYWTWRHSYEKKHEPRPSIIMEWIRAKKEKVCPIIKIT